MQIADQKWRVGFSVLLLLGIAGLSSLAFARHGEENILTNRIPEPAPYVVSETTSAGGAFGAPHTGQPFEPLWTSTNDTGSCSGCHTGLFDQWNGAMMSNAWRDPGWRGAFLLVARLTSTDGDCDIPNPPDGTTKSRINPFGNTNCTSTFNNGTTNVTYSGSGSLMDDFCSRCHMPTNYIDAVTTVTSDAPSGQEHGRISPLYDPTSINPTATVTTIDPVTGALTPESFGSRTYVDGVSRMVNSNSGQIGIVCEVCHTNVESRYTPYHLYNKSGTEYVPAPQNTGRANQGLTINQQDMVTVPDVNSPNLGYAVAAGAFRLSPHALNLPERFGPLSWNNPCSLVPTAPCVTDPFLGQSAVLDPYVSDVFSGGTRTTNAYLTQASPPGKHDTFYQVKFERAEFCASCHDVTNPVTIKNAAGFWVGGFPIERTYTEWKNSRYSDRQGNAYFNPNYKRDCETCHMQQTYGEPGTAITLYTVSGSVVTPDAPIIEPSCDRILHNPGHSHHFVGGNGYMTRLIGTDVDSGGTVSGYPELLHTSFSSDNPASRFHYARFDTVGPRRGVTATQHERFSWDRVRNALTMSVSAPASVSRPATETLAALNVVVKNEGSGHNFPTGFPEGRAAWVTVRAWDTKNTAVTTDDVELQIQDSANGNRRSLGVGDLTTAEQVDPTYPVACNWLIPEGSIDPYAYTFRAVATIDKVCPTLDLPYATAVNMVVNANNVPTDAGGTVIDRNNPSGIPRYLDTNGNGDFFDDSFLRDTRLQPCRNVGCTNPGATANLTRYSVVVPSTIVGPIAVTSAVYYQSFEGVVAKKFLGNLANTDDPDANEGFPGGRPTLEPCVLKGLCDRIGKAGATGEAELRSALLFDPVVVEGAPPVPLEVRNAVIQVTQTVDNVAPRVIINNCKPPRKGTPPCNTNLVAPIPANRHWSPSPYGGPTGNYASESYGELGVAHTRIVKVSFSEPVQECDNVAGLVNCTRLPSNTYYLTTNQGAAVSYLQAQIDDTTWGLFPYVSTDAVFLGGGGYVIHVAPTRNGRALKDYAGNTLAAGPATGGEYTFGFKAQ
jgi:hypothetical protein